MIWLVEGSNDGGKTWTVENNGFYRRPERCVKKAAERTAFHANVRRLVPRPPKIFRAQAYARQGEPE